MTSIPMCIPGRTHDSRPLGSLCWERGGATGPPGPAPGPPGWGSWAGQASAWSGGDRSLQPPGPPRLGAVMGHPGDVLAW